MKSICGCTVVGFGAKPSGFVLEAHYDEGESYFVIMERNRKEVEEHLEVEENECFKLDTSEGLEELITLAKSELKKRKGKDTDLLVHSSVLHEMCVRKNF